MDTALHDSHREVRTRALYSIAHKKLHEYRDVVVGMRDEVDIDALGGVYRAMGALGVTCLADLAREALLTGHPRLVVRASLESKKYLWETLFEALITLRNPAALEPALRLSGWQGCSDGVDYALESLGLPDCWKSTDRRLITAWISCLFAHPDKASAQLNRVGLSQVAATFQAALKGEEQALLQLPAVHESIVWAVAAALSQFKDGYSDEYLLPLTMMAQRLHDIRLVPALLHHLRSARGSAKETQRVVSDTLVALGPEVVPAVVWFIRGGLNPESGYDQDLKKALLSVLCRVPDVRAAELLVEHLRETRDGLVGIGWPAIPALCDRARVEMCERKSFKALPVIAEIVKRHPGTHFSAESSQLADILPLIQKERWNLLGPQPHDRKTAAQILAYARKYKIG
jgi:hypothetical protein